MTWLEFPLVSGLMVFTRPEQLVAARASVESFFAQDWPHKELVVYNSTKCRFKSHWPSARRVREMNLRAISLPRMEQLCLENADGEWCLKWLPDCVYEPGYIGAHMAQRDKQRLTVMGRVQALALSTNELLTIAGLCAPSWCFYRHHTVDFAQELSSQFASVEVLSVQASLVTKFACEVN